MELIFAFVLSCLGASLAIWVVDKTSLSKSLEFGFVFFFFGGAILYIFFIEFILDKLNVKNKKVRLISIFGFSFVITLALINIFRSGD